MEPAVSTPDLARLLCVLAGSLVCSGCHGDAHELSGRTPTGGVVISVNGTVDGATPPEIIKLMLGNNLSRSTPKRMPLCATPGLSAPPWTRTARKSAAIATYTWDYFFLTLG